MMHEADEPDSPIEVEGAEADAAIKIWSAPQVIEITKPTEPEPREPTPRRRAVRI